MLTITIIKPRSEEVKDLRFSPNLKDIWCLSSRLGKNTTALAVTAVEPCH